METIVSKELRDQQGPVKVLPNQIAHNVEISDGLFLEDLLYSSRIIIDEFVAGFDPLSASI